MKRILFILSSLLFMTFAVFAENAKTINLEMSMTDINGTTYNVRGKESGLDIEGLEGKVIFLDFFGQRCPPCLEMIPHNIALQEKYRDRLVILGLEVQGHSEEKNIAFIEKEGINYRVFTDQGANQVISYVAQRAEWNGSIPFLVALDTKGDVKFVQAGMLSQENLEELVEKLSEDDENHATITEDKK